SRFPYLQRPWKYMPPSVTTPMSNSRYNLRPRRNQPFNIRNPLPQGSVARGRKGKPPCRRCGRLHLGQCQLGTSGCFNCGQEGHFHRDYSK
ncbi:MAG: hypothetical protein Q8843_01255, partial [Candidatus Phytoplasma australasiaticum]|nr:hypothetical protein [Candidatus Phytoplasma australasiaticum]